jgi:hypothetical protein
VLRGFADEIVAAARAIRAEGMACPTVCVGGTPAALAAMDMPEVTEVCAGAYALYDTGMAALGLCDLDDVAIWTESEQAALDLVGEHRYPWVPLQEAAGCVEGRWLPEHVYAVVLRTGTVQAADGGQWPVRIPRDTPAGSGS